MQDDENAAIAGAPSLDAPVESTSPRKGRTLIQGVSLVLASLWLIASIVVGAVLMLGGPTQPADSTTTLPNLTSSATKELYGGDAYTGIQNAAADTENAVVKGTNGLAQLQLSIAQSQAAADKGAAKNLEFGLGFLIIGVGVLTFTSALQRFGRR